jgi:hypothetical protein
MLISILLIVVILGIFGYMIYEQQRRKAEDTRSHHKISLSRFPTVDVPVALSRVKAKSIARKLKRTYLHTWDALAEIYNVGPIVRAAPIAKIGMSMDPVDPPKHPHIRWTGDAVHIKVQPEMYYHFAGELHNMFRYYLYGRDEQGYIKKPKTPEELHIAQAAYLWIQMMYGEVE